MTLPTLTHLAPLTMPHPSTLQIVFVFAVLVVAAGLLVRELKLLDADRGSR